MPEDTRFAVVTEALRAGGEVVVLSRHLHVLVGDGFEHRTSRRGYPVHVPDHVLAGCGVPPEDIGLAVVIEVGSTHHLPGLVGKGIEGSTSRTGYPIHVPDRVLARGSVP